ncbi:unnamed protein product, partial [Effrenium voratum]
MTIAGAVPGPCVISEEIPHKPEDFVGELELSRPLGGPLWWNSLLWTNFPSLAMFSDQKLQGNSEFFGSLAALNSDQRLSEQYVTFTAARHDLCNSRDMPKKNCRLTAECMQYEGVRDCQWKFPLQDYIPKRDNHNTPDVQARRFWDNNVLHMGLNAEEFSEKVMPVGDIEVDPNTFLVAHPAGKTLVEGLAGQGPGKVFSIEPWAASKKTNPPQMLEMRDDSGQVVLSVSGKCEPREDTTIVDGTGKMVAVLRTAQAQQPKATAGWDSTSWLILGTQPRAPGQAVHVENLYLWAKLT